MIGMNGEGPYFGGYRKHPDADAEIPWWVALGMVIGIILFAVV